ncbi:MAG: putative DNA binding domain-containing protein [Verrucomicrobiota bacterium]|nr:putative DNA binding domain-containing protein [Verrucomicrobiota bacterium]
MGRSNVGSRRFMRDVVGASLGISLLALGAVVYLAMQARHTISERYIDSAASRAVTEFRSMQASVAASLGLVRDYGTSGVVALSKPDGLKDQLFPIFKQKTMLSGITIADAEGRSYFILPDGTERMPSEADGFDPRERPWFEPALEADGVYWTEQYLFHTLKKPGITASTTFLPKGAAPVVVAFDVLLDDLYREIKKMAPSKNSDLFLFRRDELLLLPGSGENATGFAAVGSITNQLARRAHLSWKGGQAPESEVVSFLHEGKVWWCGFQPLEGSQGNVWMGVVLPESDIMGDISRRWILLWAFGFVFVLLSVGTAYGLTRRYGRVFESTPVLDAGKMEEGIRELIGQGENRSVEFKSTMRMNLHTGKPGKEIEIAWLKGIAGFLNTDGGTLLIGVADDGEIVGLERDVFENEDKCRLHFKNLVATHIGAEMSAHIRFSMVPMVGKTVGVVQCTPASKPVYLRNANKESFYIRNGPSSDELPVSKLVGYIEDHWS